MSDVDEEIGDEIVLKWGTLKGWNITEDNKPAMKLLKQYHKLGVCSSSVMLQKDTEKQKKILIDLVSLPEMKIYLDWDAKYVSKAEAVSYLKNYGKE